MIDPIEERAREGKGSFPCPSCGSAASDAYEYPYCPRGCTAEQMLEGARAEAAVPQCTQHRTISSQTCVACMTRTAYARREGQRRLDASGDDDGDDWAPESLVDVEPVPEPSVLRVGDQYLLRRGWITLIHGAFGSAKTPVCFLAVVEQVKAGHLAIIVDYEMGPAQTKALLKELSLTDEEIEAGVYYLYSPGPPTPARRRRMIEEVARRGREVTVVVIDSLTESMAMVPGASDNDAQDVNAWANDYPKWLCTQFNAAVAVIDHSGVDDGPRPSGSHKKRDFPQFHLWCRKGVPFSRSDAEAGYSDLLPFKDRSGDSLIGQPVARVRTEPGGSFYLEPPHAPKTGVIELALDRQPEGSTYEEVYAELLGIGPEGTLRTDLTGSGSRGQYRRGALDRLLHEGRAVERAEPGSARGKRVWADEHAPE